MPARASRSATLPQLEPVSPGGRRPMPPQPPPPLQAEEATPGSAGSSSGSAKGVVGYLMEVSRPPSGPGISGSGWHGKTALEAAGVAATSLEVEFTRHRSERATASTRRSIATRGAAFSEVREAPMSGSMSPSSPIVAKRRTMAAIAGGGFRGPASTPQSTCMCDILRARLSRANSELRELRSSNVSGRQSKAALSYDFEDDPDLSASLSASAMGFGSAATVSTADASVQASLLPESSGHQTCEIGVQASPPPIALEAVEVQAGSGAIMRNETASQAAPAMADFAAQAEVEVPPPAPLLLQPPPPHRTDTAEAEVQTCPEAPPLEAPATAEFATQAGTPSLHLSSRGAQTEALQVAAVCSELATQTDPEEREEPRSCTTQGCQTEVLPSRSSAVQTVERRGVDKHTQKDDSDAAHRKVEMAKLDHRVKALVAEAAESAAAKKAAREDEEAWKHMAQSKALGQLNVTILCPRAECTVNGARLEMDSWDPARLTAEFEREVLPRFSRVFVEEHFGEEKTRPRPEAIDRTMAEFAEVFRKRLAAMLAAPSAAAAVAAHGPQAPGAAGTPTSAARPPR